ncbi:RNA 2',3'-cyclic phosphodiesterase [Paenibacillus harenae]|uniref:RNA 2',3'-cyclic phosphodiesterase n=1 Tax=Paenibacillus harenae TaxID=306543 RepID=UPI00040B8BCF|nr:RNA 2',3'-cyclic phosphodiesterase [Paenibacillus harenae]
MRQPASKEQTMRLFAAVPLPGTIAGELEEWARKQKSRLSFRKWVHPQDYHITLQFLGDTPASKTAALQTALGGVRGGAFRLSLNGAGTFGSPNAPRVLWAGVAGELERLIALHSAVANATGPLGFALEERPYAPHITLARTFSSGNASAPMPEGATADAPSGMQWEADRFVLMRTHMHASPMYEVIGEFPLREA